MFRYDPVPGTGKHKTIDVWFRINKTYSIQKYEAYDKKFVKAKRASLPAGWDYEKVSSKYGIHNWKRTKKQKQWM